MNSERPLDGKRIVITRAVEQSRDLKERLENLGARVLMLPAVSFSEPSDTIDLDRAINALKTFDWVLFTSANAVRFFAGRCRRVGGALDVVERPRYAAVGPATAVAAIAEGFTIDHVAKEFAGAALVRELGASLIGKRVLLPRSDRAGRELPDALKRDGAEVTEVVAYLTGGVGVAEPGVIDAMREGNVDAVLFFSPSAVENLRQELGPDSFARLGSRVALAAVGPTTASALRNFDLLVAFEATEATSDSMVASIAKYFSGRNVSQARSL